MIFPYSCKRMEMFEYELSKIVQLCKYDYPSILISLVVNVWKCLNVSYPKLYNYVNMIILRF